MELGNTSAPTKGVDFRLQTLGKKFCRNLSKSLFFLLLFNYQFKIFLFRVSLHIMNEYTFLKKSNIM